MRSPLGTLARIARPADRSPVPYSPRGATRMPLPLTGGTSGPDAHLRAMGSVGTLFAIVDRLASATAAADWGLFREANPDQRPEDREQVTRHLAADIWDKPNEHFTQSLFIETCQQHYELVGEAWWVVARDPRATFPMELWPVMPTRMLPIPDPDNYLAGYEYLGPDGQRIPLGLDEVIQIRRPNPVDAYRGIGAVQTILADLQGVRLSAEWNRNFFLNSAEPGGIVEFPEGLGDEEFEEFTTRWREQHQGVSNAHKVAIIERGKWVNRSFSQRDMQFVELRGVTREVIREAFGISAFELGLVEDVNRATADASKAVFAEGKTVPRLDRIKQALNSRFLPMFGPTGTGVEFDYESPVPADREADDRERESMAKAARDLIEAGAYGPEVLAAMGLPEIAFGQPGADPDRELLIDLVKGAPTLAPLILPMLGFELPEDEPEPDPLPALPPAPEQAAIAPPPDDPDDEDGPIEAAMRWVAVCRKDVNSCTPCELNDGHLYRNRADAYKDYPGGEGYVRCEGEANCRCTVVKRRKGADES